MSLIFFCSPTIAFVFPIVLFFAFCRDAFISIHENCLIDEEFASKTIGMVSAASFKNVHVHGVKLRNLFIEQFQNDYEGIF